MALRLIETVLPEKDGAEIRELLKELKVLEHRQVGELPPQEEAPERIGREELGRKVFDDRFLSRRGSLEVPVIGVAFPKWSLERLHKRATVVDPVLKTHHRVRPCKRGSRGPKEADALIAPGGSRHNWLLKRART